MSFVLKFAKTIRNNWKKSVFFTGLVVYGVHYGQGLYQDSLLRRAYCLEAKLYGDHPLRTGERTRKVTVFLNPAAKKGKAKKLFDKNVAPILHLAGLEVTVVRTEYEGQAKKYMDVLEETDAIVVAGGDGTLAEVVTGLLRRKDEGNFSRIPLGVIPLGHTNTLAKTLHDKDQTDVKWLLDAALSVVKGTTRPIDIMKIIDQEDRTVFAVNDLHWGAYKEAQRRAKKYWYFGPLKHRWSYLMTAVGKWPPVVQAELAYTNSCSGCSRCYTPPPKPQWKWWHIFLPPKIPVVQKDYSNIENVDCGIEYNDQLRVVEITASLNTPDVLHSKPEERGVNLAIGPESIEKTEFIKEGWKRIKEESDNVGESRQVEEFKLTPEGEQVHANYIIDNEQFEIMPITVKLLRDKLNVFYLPSL